MPASIANERALPATKTAAPSRARLQYAIKTSLSLMLAYLIPMALGWPQPQTAVTTVMLIAATGMLSESLQKGILRIVGTVIGAAIGLSLIALFPQERMIYLFATSCVVSIIIYLYNAYQGDSTVFMLTAVVTLMVFNGGEADGAFLYGIDRTFMTAFGVIVYTVVASMLWPIKAADNTRHLAAGMANRYRDAFTRLLRPSRQQDPPMDEYLSQLATEGASFATQFAMNKNHADGVADYLPEWNSIVGGYEELEALLVPALNQSSRAQIEFELYINNYSPVTERVEALFSAIDAAWRGQHSENNFQALDIEFNTENLREATHLVTAAVAARTELLHSAQKILLELLAAMDSLLFDQSSWVTKHSPRKKPSFHWLDIENLKTALRAFLLSG